MGAGLLPIALNRGTLLVLLGQERYQELWCDFGGRSDRGETDYETALREGKEELNGFLGSGGVLHSAVNDSFIKSFTNSRDKYISYLFKIKYDNKLPFYFNNNNAFIESHLPDLVNEEAYKKHTGLFEKNKIKWFTTREIARDLHKFRPHYIPILKELLAKEAELISTMYESNKKSRSESENSTRKLRKIEK